MSSQLPEESAHQAALLVLGSEGQRLRKIVLPPRGICTIGRADDNFVRLGDGSVSRRHARLYLGEAITIEDLGSDNGTWVLAPPDRAAAAEDATRQTDGEGRRLGPGERADLSWGSLVRVGSQTLVLERANADEPRRVWSRAHLMGQLEEACARGTPAGPSLLRVKGEASIHRALVDLVLAIAGETDVVASSTTGEIELMVDGDRGRAVELAAWIEERGAEAALAIRVGIAHCPENGHTAHALLTQTAATVGSDEPATPIVVIAPAMRELHAMAARVASTPMPVLLLGETGVGKEVIAEAIHRASPRATRPFLCINCGALSENLLESELFGHERGAFTGALRAKQGLLEAAAEGTVLLDEIGELSMPLQVKLLRVIENKRMLRVGSVRQLAIDVRFIGATNRDLEQEVAAGGFRADLYFRIGAVTLRIPPLRERTIEIEPLARHFLAEACRATGRWPEPELAPDAAEALSVHSWPGNVRELKNVIERALLQCHGERIERRHLPLDQMKAALTFLREPAAPTIPPLSEHETQDGSDADERERILRALDECAGNQTRAAKLLGISRRTLVSRLGQYNLPRPRKP